MGGTIAIKIKSCPENDPLLVLLGKELDWCYHMYDGCDGCRYLKNCRATFDAGVSSRPGFKLTDRQYSAIKHSLIRVGCAI